MAARPFAHNSSPDHQQLAALPHQPPPWSWHTIEPAPASPSLPGRHDAIQHLTLPPMHTHHDADSDFDRASTAQPEPSATRSSFLARILNSGEDASDTRRPAATAAASSSHSSNPPYTLTHPAQPPPSTTQYDPRRHPSHGYVDLTREQTPPISQERSTLRTLHHDLHSAVETPSNPDSAASPLEPASLSSSPMAPTGRRKRETTSPLFMPLSPSPKRVKRDDGSSSGGSSRRRRSRQTGPSSGPSNAAAGVEDVERIDLIDDDTPLAEALQKQRAEQVKAQQESQNGADAPPRLSNLTCVICMDTPTDLTATACGHVFCHTCLMEALIAGEARAGPGEPKRSQCPVCRKALSRNKAGDIIPLLLMKKGLATQPRRQKATATTPA